MRTIKFRAISFKGVFYSKSLDKYYVSEPCRYDSGVTSLSLLFDIESERGIEDILSSTHFINTIGEQYWDRDWVKIGNIQFTGLLDKNGMGLTEVYEGDIIDENGIIKGSIYEMDKRETDIVIPQLGTKAWESAYKEAVVRGFNYSE